MRAFLSPEERRLLRGLPPMEAALIHSFFNLLDARLIPHADYDFENEERNLFSDEWGDPNERGRELIEEARDLADKIAP